MSALPQRVRPTSYKRAAKAAGPKLVHRIRPLHWRKSRDQVADPIRKSAWAPTAVLPTRFYADFFRVCGGALGGLMAGIAHHTFAAPHDPRAKGWTAAEWTEPMTDSDFGQEIGFTRDMMEDAIEEAIERKLIERRSDVEPDAGGEAFFQYRWANTKSWKKLSTRFNSRVKPKPPGTAEEAEPETDSEETAKGGIAIPSKEVASGSTVKVAEIPPAEKPFMVKVLHNLGAGLQVNPTLKGSTCLLKISFSSCAEGESAPGAAPAGSDLAGAGLLPPGLHITAPGWKEFAAVLQQLTAPKPGGGYIACPIYLDQQTASSLVKKLKTPLEFFAECARERVSRLIRNNEPVTSAAAAWIVDNANDKWKVAGPVQRAQQEYEQQQLHQAQARQSDLDTDWEPAAVSPDDLRRALKAAQSIGNRPEVARLKALIAELESK